jgi:predicted dehydrogenase
MTGMGIHLLDSFSFLIGPMHRVSALSTRRELPLETGDTTAALIEFRNGATGTIATSLKTPYVWRLAVYGSAVWAESTGENDLKIQRSSGKLELLSLEPVNHIHLNLESFAAAALGQGKFHIDDNAILHTVAGLDAVFRSTEKSGAWQDVT